MLSGLLKLTWNDNQRSTTNVRIIPSPLPTRGRFSLVSAVPWFNLLLGLNQYRSTHPRTVTLYTCNYGSLSGKNKPEEEEDKGQRFFRSDPWQRKMHGNAYSLSNGLMAQESRPLGKGGNSLFIMSWVTQRGLASFGYKSDPQRA